MTDFPPIAIVGRACLLPGASSPEELWDAVVHGRDLVSTVPSDRWGMAPADVLSDSPEDDRTWSDRGGYVEGFDQIFVPDGFELPASEIAGLDPVFQWTLHTAREALRDAGHDGADPTRFGAVFGNLSFPSAKMAAFTQATTIAGLPGYGPQALADADLKTPDARNRFTSGLPALVLERALRLGSGALALDAACASSLYAIKLACDRLHDGSADLMLAGAVNSADDLCIHLGFSALTALSRTGQSRPFNDQADGLVPAEGCGFVALRLLDTALAEGDTVHGIIRGVGLSNDGRSRGLLVPSSDGQARAIAQAVEQAGVSPTAISMLECHATGTQVGDRTEITSSAQVYGECSDLPIGSLKSNLGHLITAAGVAGLIKVLEAMRHETRPPTLHVDDPIAAVDDSPFRLLTEAEPWDRTATADGVLRAGVSAFGFGGNNAHLIVEEPGQQAGQHRSDPRTIPTPLAIVGIGITAASAVGRQAFADAMISQNPCLDENGEGRMGDVSLALKGQKFPPNDLKKTLAQQLAMLQVTDEALADSGPLPNGSTGVYVGMGTDPEAARFGVRWRLATMARAWGAGADWLCGARDDVGPALDAPGVLGTMPNIVANRLNSQHDLAGPSFTVSSEERSGLDAIDLAARALRAGEIDAALVGAVDLSCEPVHRAASQACIAADRGTPGDAAVMLVLKRLDEAERDGNTVYAVLPGGRFDETGDPLVDRPDLQLGLADGVRSVSHLFGHAHAASGLLHLTAAALSLHHRVEPGNSPLLPSNPASGCGLPVGVGPRTASVLVEAMDGIVSSSILLAEAAGHLAPSPIVPPAVHIFSGQTPTEVVRNAVSGNESNQGPARLVIVADSEAQRSERIERACAHIQGGNPAGVGVHYQSSPIQGDLAFVYTAAGAAYTGMGEQLLQALPELVNSVGSSFPLRDMAGWVYGEGESADRQTSPDDFLWGSSLLSQAHTSLTRDILKLQPSAAIGYSSGETNSLHALGIWGDMDAMRADIAASRMMTHELGVEFAAIARAWGSETANWAMWNVLAPRAEVEAVVAAEERVHIAIINTSADVVIGGDADRCNAVVAALGSQRCRPVAYNLACHVPEVATAFHQEWVDVHTRAVTPQPGLRVYSNGVTGSYDVSTTACAAAITLQAENTLDFPATIEAAYTDGVRIFVEHGPAGACTNFVGQILAGRPHLAIQLDRRGRNIQQVYDAVAALLAAGIDVDHRALSKRLQPALGTASIVDGPVMAFPAHPDPVRLPARPVQEMAVASKRAMQQRGPSPSEAFSETTMSGSSGQMMAPAPLLPSVFDPIPGSTAIPAEPMAEVLAMEVGPTDDTALVIQQQIDAAAALHSQFLQQQATIHSQFLQMRAAMPPVSAVYTPGDGAVGVTSSDELSPLTLGDRALTERSALVDTNRPAPNVAWDKEQLKIHSSGRIADLFGPMFEPQAGRTIQCRMPEPPLLLADRVTGLVGEPGVLGKGTIWTETDVQADSWYLNNGYMPAGFMIESGQADLMLISYMGIDLPGVGSVEGEEERSYRLLGCTLTYHGDLPSPGETLEYEIRITGHAQHGGIRIFFFEYDCTVNGEPRLTVRDAQAGFFNATELAEALGVLWTPETGRADLGPDARVDPPAIVCTKSSFSKTDVVAFSEGRVVECFGPEYEWTHTHTRTPSIQSGPQLFIDEVTQFDPAGGPWGRGFMRCETAIADDAWFFDGHFKNDPCMPGNFMVEACIEALSFYLAGMGYTAERDGWRFQPLPDQPFELKCRGEINPQTEHVAYEVHVEEVHAGPHPTVICDVVGFVDGKAAFHAHRIGVELVPDWPLTSMPELYEDVIEPVPVATDSEGFPFDWKAMISCAWGRPSEAFGSMYRMFDGTRRSPRLPGEPYHFISRIIEIDGELDVCEAGMKIVCEYDIPDDAWYFDENGTETMPFAVLLEAALQPCGWVASAIGSSTGYEDDMLFRNLDGTGTLVDELTRTAGTLTTRVELKSVSVAGGMVIEGFDVECLLGDRVVYRMDTVFGFFPPDAFVDQVGLPITDVHRGRLESNGPGDVTVDLTDRPERFCGGTARLAQSMLLMLDRATHVRGAGAAGLGVVRGEKDVDISEWFFKAHFFQDPVQPGSLGIEALLQLLQFFMLDTDMAGPGAEFEPIMLGSPMSWKYRGQVTPRNSLISSTMEITEVGTDEHGPFVIGTGSLWCDGLRIYEVSNMGMRLKQAETPPSGSRYELRSDVPLDQVKQSLRTYWQPRRATPTNWLGDDLMDGLVDRYVNRIVMPNPKSLEQLQGRSVIFLANHQVQIESLIVSNLLPAITGVSMTTVANAKHQNRWIGQVIEKLDSFPGAIAVDQIAYFDQTRPDTMLDLIDLIRQRMKGGPYSFFVHTDGTRAQSCRTPNQRCSSVFLDLALEMNVPIVPMRFTGGLPIQPIEGKSEFGVDHRPQDYWLGECIEPDTLRSMPLRQRVDHVVAAVNDLAMPNAVEQPLMADPEFAAEVERWQRESGTGEVFAAMWALLAERPNPGPDTRLLIEASRSGRIESDGTERGDWLANAGSIFLGEDRPLKTSDCIVINRSTHPHLVDHAINDVPVVPVVYVLEWFARQANQHLRGFGLSELADLKVLKGIVVDQYSADGDLQLVVSATTVDSNDDHTMLLMELTDQQSGRVHYRCTARINAGGGPPAAARLAPVPTRSLSQSALPVYSGGVLFHGPAFQVIVDAPRICEQGLEASLVGLVDRGWPSEEWISDPALLDGGLQLALLWTEHLLDGPSLPTSIGAIRIFGGPVEEALDVTLTALSSTASRVACDISFSTSKGVVVAEMTGVETHRLPG